MSTPFFTAATTPARSRLLHWDVDSGDNVAVEVGQSDAREAGSEVDAVDEGGLADGFEEDGVAARLAIRLADFSD